MKNDQKYDLSEPPQKGCYVYGLFIDGARWNTEEDCIDEPFPKILNYSMPYIWLQPFERSHIDKAQYVSVVEDILLNVLYRFMNVLYIGQVEEQVLYQQIIYRV